ncbi:PAS domain S-box protein [Amphritea sp. 2_MG-2023]|uniref:PAS domain S-box protein n=1 Tax=Amphritea TaxID=515417 RepID=UPI001C07521B|nr:MULTISPECIES: PAS domain S-box protein [Amphritea]MBU2964856.1 PAS domain S-box protein [Amphritea atlantica]MDO6419569.1 PAS domain S-box protein [Amphritea sp. 2_MG-2023]
MKSNSSGSSSNQLLNNTQLLLEALFNQSLTFVAILSPEGQVLDVNDSVLKSKGFTKDDFIGKPIWKSPLWCNFPEWETIWKQRLVEASQLQTPVITKDIFQGKDGSDYYAEASATALYDPDNGELLGYLVQAIDTTKCQLIEDKNQANEARLEFILERCHIGSWDYNHIDDTAHRSLMHDQIFGYDQLLPQWTYEMFLNHVIPEERDDVDKGFQQAVKNKADFTTEFRIRRKDGEIRWILASSGHPVDATGLAKLRAGTVQDITELKQAEIAKLSHSAELQSLFNALPDTYYRMTSDGTILDYRAQQKSEQDENPDNFVGKRMADFLPDDIALLFQSKIDEALQAEQAVTFNYALLANHQMTHCDVRLNRIPHSDQLICVIRDVTDEFKSKESLATSEQLFRTFFEQAAVGVALVDAEKGTFVRINQRFCDMLGFSVEEMVNGKHFRAITHPDDLPLGLNNLEAIRSGKKRKASQEKRYIHKDGHVVWVELSVSSTSKNGEPAQTMIAIAQDINLRKKAEEKLQLSARVFSDTQEGIVITDAQQLIVDTNPAFSQITGYSREDVLGKSTSLLSSGKQSPQFYAQMWAAITENGHWQGEVWNRTKEGELFAELLNISSLTNEHNQVTHYVGVFSDITSIKRQQEKLNLMAHYDVLTNLPNRTLFIDRFHQSIAHSKRTGHQLAVCFLDLDDFKPVNDNYGHDIGDRLLVEVAARITGCIRDEDTVSRQGGDEFAILLNDIKCVSEYEVTIQRLHQVLAMPYFIDSVQHKVTASSGVTLYPSDSGDIDTLLRHADNAMYQSKLLGKHRSQLYSPDSDQRIIQKNLQLEEIEQALVNHEFQLYYQPKVNMVTGEVFGVEALIRWLHPEKGLIPPLAFLPYIDGAPLEIRLGEWVINEALQQLNHWQQQGVDLEVSINISSDHLLSPMFVTVLEKYIAAYPSVNAQRLQLEILESSALGDLNTITRIIETCQNSFGVSFALDDFGTGYSSLTHLRSLPVNTIKIDQSFVRDVLDDPSDYSIIEGVISLTKAFNRNVIAEGVETSNHGLMLLVMGCEQAQGYAIAKPMPAGSLIQWLNDYIPNKAWLDCGQQQRSNKEKSLEIFRLINNQWIEKLRSKVACSGHDMANWPIFDHQLCQCASWIRREQQNQLFDKEEVQRLKETHAKLHAMADLMQRQYDAGDITAARASLSALELVFEELSKGVG